MSVKEIWIYVVGIAETPSMKFAFTSWTFVVKIICLALSVRILHENELASFVHRSYFALFLMLLGV